MIGTKYLPLPAFLPSVWYTEVVRELANVTRPSDVIWGDVAGPRDVMGIREELQDLYNAYAAAYSVGDAAACAAAFAPDGELFSPYAPPARGREAIEALHEDWTRGGVGQKQLVVVAVGASGDLAWCLAAYSEGLATGNGMSLNVLERQLDGHWLIRVCSLNSSDPT